MIAISVHLLKKSVKELGVRFFAHHYSYVATVVPVRSCRQAASLMRWQAKCFLGKNISSPLSVLCSDENIRHFDPQEQPIWQI
ncbi:hypothetical protein KAU04_00635 [bacterium]|nr:hypothetical protein [bacterium]